MPYNAPLGFQTPIPPQGQTFWDDPYNQPPSPNSPLYDIATEKASRMHEDPNEVRIDPVQLALQVAGGPLMRFAPRAAAALGGAFFPMLPEWAFGQGAQKAGAPDPQYKSQKTLRMEAEAAREAAKAAAEKSRTDAAQKAIELQQSQEAARAAEADRQLNAAAQAEATRKAQAEEAAAKIRREASDKAQAEATKTLQNEPPSFVQTYGPAIGTVGGLTFGKVFQGGVPYFGKGGMQGKIFSAKEAEAARANQLVGDIESSAGNASRQQSLMNQFVTEGGGKTPFPPNAPMSPAPDFSKLYQSRTPMQNFGPMGVAGTVGGVETYAGHNIYSTAKQEEAEAEAEFKRLAGTGTDAEYTAAVQKLIRARQKAALGDMLFRGGIYTGVGAGAGEVSARTIGTMPRPDVGRAEAAYRNMQAPPQPPQAPLSPGQSILTSPGRRGVQIEDYTAEAPPTKHVNPKTGQEIYKDPATGRIVSPPEE